MMVILASRFDQNARELAHRWSQDDAVVCTPEDLSRGGWRQYHSAESSCTAMIAGRKLGLHQITGVLTRLPVVAEFELPHLATEDRRYVASEMTAFLVSWLSRLKCPVLNRPGTVCLSGQGWRPAQWTYFAALLGIPVKLTTRRISLALGATPSDQVPGASTAVVVGKRCFGSLDPCLHDHARRLAEAASAELLAVHFDGADAGARFIAADLIPAISSPEIADSIRAHLLGDLAC